MSKACKMKWPIRRAAFELLDKLVLEGEYRLIPHYQFIKGIAAKQTGQPVTAKQMKYLGGLHYQFIKDETKRDWWRDQSEYFEETA